MTKEARKQRNQTGIKKNTYNNFSPLQNEIECAYCNNFGHGESKCRSKLQPKENIPTNSKVWRNKDSQVESCGITLFSEGKENQWYTDSGCWKHMTSDRNKLLAYNALEREKNVTFGNDTPTIIKGKGSIFLKEKVKANNVMYVDGLKHNLLSVSEICDQVNEVALVQKNV